MESHLTSMLSLHPDNPLTQTGIRSELSHGGLRSRLGRNRTDLVHQPLDPMIVVGPWVAAFGFAYAGAKAVAKRIRD